MKKYLLSLLIVGLCLISVNFKVKGENNTYYNLKDHYVIKVGNQAQFNNCWSYATLTSLETCLMVNTSEYYNFSEAYLTLLQKVASPYALVGSLGSDLFTGFELIKQYGVVLEQDFPFDDLFYVNNDNYLQVFEHYQKYAFKDIINNISVKTYYFNEKEAIMNHLHQNGSVNLNMTNIGYKLNPIDNTYYATSSTKNGGHAVSIIGYDLNYQAVIDGVTYTGAFIVQNSYGSNSQSDGIFYYLFDYINNYNKLYGFVYESNNQNVINLNESDYNITLNNLNNKCLNNNIFKDGNHALTYQAKDVLKVEVYQNYKNVTNKFKITNDLDQIKITPLEKACGSYKLKFIFKDHEVIKEAVYMTNLDIEYIAYLPNASLPNQIMYSGYYIDNNHDNLLIGNKTTSRGILLLTVSPYFKVLNIEASAKLDVDKSLLTSNRLYIYFNETNQGIYQYSLTLSNEDASVTYDITYALGDYKLSKVLVNTDLGAYEESLFRGNVANYQIAKPSYDGYTFKEAVSKDKTLNTDETSIYLNNDDFTYYSGLNKYTQMFPNLVDYKYLAQINLEYEKDLLDFNIELIPYCEVYDGKPHQVTINYLEDIEDVTVLYSTDGINYENKVIEVTNVLDSTNVYIKFIKDGYHDLILSSSITILKKTPVVETSLEIHLQEKISSLNEISLPNHYYFKSSTFLGYEHIYDAYYDLNDDNYEVVENIKVKLILDVEDKPIEDKPIEDKPIEDKPIEDKPIEDKPIEDKPNEDNKPKSSCFNKGVISILQMVIALQTLFIFGYSFKRK